MDAEWKVTVSTDDIRDAIDAAADKIGDSIDEALASDWLSSALPAKVPE